MKYKFPTERPPLAERMLADEKPLALIFYVRAESWAPVWLQLCWLRLKRLVGKL